MLSPLTGLPRRMSLMAAVAVLVPLTTAAAAAWPPLHVGDAVAADHQLLPGFFLEPAAAVPPLVRRDAACSSGYHSCLDINSTLCCANDRYCMIDPDTWKPACCAIGSVCGSPCEASKYQCNATTTVAVAVTVSTTIEAATTTGAMGVSAVVLTSTSTSTYEACCPRRCPATSQFACASSLGGGCCHFGQACASKGLCIGTVSGSASSTASATGTTPAIVTTTTATTGSDGGRGSSSDSLSAGAKIGIGLGIGMAAALVVGGLTLCFLRRHRSSSDGSRHANGQIERDGMSDNMTAPFPQLPVPALSARLGGDQSRSGGGGSSSKATRSWRHPFSRRNTESVAEGSGSGGAGGGNFGSVGGAAAATAATASAAAVAVSRARGGTREYLGPDAVPGPFTDQANPGNVGGDGAILPGTTAATGPPDHGVPMRPHGPNDIVAPVELDSRAMPVAEMEGSPVVTKPPPSLCYRSHGITTTNADEKGDAERTAYGLSSPDTPLSPLSPLSEPSQPSPQHYELDSTLVTGPAEKATDSSTVNDTTSSTVTSPSAAAQQTSAESHSSGHPAVYEPKPGGNAPPSLPE